MSRELHRWADQYPTITFKLSKSSATTEAEIWTGWIPLNDLLYDDRPGIPAYTTAFLDAAFGDTDGPLSGVRLRLRADTKMDAARQIVRNGVAFEIELDDGVEAFTDIPLVVYCLGLASDGPAYDDITLPTADTNFTDWSVKDVNDAGVPAKFELVSTPISIDGIDGGDSSTVFGS